MMRNFVKKEYETVMEYCRKKKFLVEDDDLFCIVNRGLNDSYEFQRAEYIEDLWLEFGDIPMNLDTECIEEEWNGFAAGTHRIVRQKNMLIADVKQREYLNRKSELYGGNYCG